MGRQLILYMVAHLHASVTTRVDLIQTHLNDLGFVLAVLRRRRHRGHVVVVARHAAAPGIVGDG